MLMTFLQVIILGTNKFNLFSFIKSHPTTAMINIIQKHFSLEGNAFNNTYSLLLLMMQYTVVHH